MDDGNNSAEIPESKTKRNLNIFTTFLLGLIAIATAWSGYQSSNWSSLTSQYYTISSGARSDSVKSSLEANQIRLLDIQIFMEWLNATAQNNTQLADFYRERMRDEAQPAFNAWLAQQPLKNPEAPSSPFVMQEYVIQKQVEADQALTRTTEYFDKAVDASDIAGQYVLITVILASALFFAGLSTRFMRTRLDMALAIFALLSFVYGVVRILMLWAD